MPTKPDDDISVAYRIATELEAAGYDAESGGVVLAMALGILVAAHPKGHRDMRPLIVAQLRAAQIAFDAIRVEGSPN